VKYVPLPLCGNTQSIAPFFTLPLAGGSSAARGGRALALHARTRFLATIKLIFQTKFLGDGASNCFGILFNFLIRKSQDSPSKLLQFLLTLQVVFDGRVVVSPIDLNNELLGDAGEIKDPIFDGMFATKLQTADLFAAQDAP